MVVRAHISNRLIELKKEALIGKGGEGSIYVAHNDPAFAVKIFHNRPDDPPGALNERYLKIDCMLRNTPAQRVAGDGSYRIAWPEEILYDAFEPSRFVGYLMPYTPGMESLLNIYHPDKRLDRFPHFTFRSLLEIALHATEALIRVHEAGHVFGDLNGANILVGSDTRVSIVDTDSFQIRDPETGALYRCTVGTTEFTAPELLSRPRLSQIDRTVEQDLFAFGVILFKLLMEGWHPFEGIVRSARESRSLAENIRRGYFPYNLRRDHCMQPEPASPHLDILSPHLQEIFIQCFESGHYSPSQRPTLRLWREMLTASIDDLVECPRNARHLYTSHLLYCPWCERKKFHKGLDLFPALEEIAHCPDDGIDTGRFPS